MQWLCVVIVVRLYVITTHAFRLIGLPGPQ